MNTVESVAKQLVEGLENGSIVLRKSRCMTEAEMIELTNRDISSAMYGGCTDYYCACHLALPECLKEIQRLKKQVRQLEDVIGGTKGRSESNDANFTTLGLAAAGCRSDR